MYFGIPPAVEHILVPDAPKNAGQAPSKEKREMTLTFRLNCNHLQHHYSPVTGYLPYFLMFGQRPRLLASLLFPTARWQEMTQTIDEYVFLYNTFRGQWWKLKNWWGSELHTVVERVVGGIPPYVVTNNKTGRRKVLHWAHFLLWLAEEDGEPLRDHGTQLFAHAHTGATPEEFQCQYYDPSKQDFFGSKFLEGGYGQVSCTEICMTPSCPPQDVVLTPTHYFDRQEEDTQPRPGAIPYQPGEDHWLDNVKVGPG